MAIQPTKPLEGSTDPTRPRILAKQEDFDRAERLIETDEYVRSWHEKLFDQLSEVDEDDPLGDFDYETLDRKGMGGVRENSARIAMLAYAYRMTDG